MKLVLKKVVAEFVRNRYAVNYNLYINGERVDSFDDLLCLPEITEIQSWFLALYVQDQEQARKLCYVKDRSVYDFAKKFAKNFLGSK